MLPSTDQERLGNKEDSLGSAFISLGKGNKRDFVSELGVGRDGNMRGHI